MLHSDGAVLSHLFPAADIGVMASSVAVAVVLGAVILGVETNLVPTTMTVATMDETRHSAPSTLPSNPCLREGKGEGDAGVIVEGGGKDAIIAAAINRRHH